ncbi:hypothetical protein J2S74_000927 [Evansella vedderi]|uniref:Uncharacterized protein n=1 Tax=Evansella vedderi TaxID=38282 RepID=A0ABT9ZTR4_9BACI|nr:hypothetical protein [Evansella vedderi]
MKICVQLVTAASKVAVSDSKALISASKVS